MRVHVECSQLLGTSERSSAIEVKAAADWEPPTFLMWTTLSMGSTVSRTVTVGGLPLVILQ